MKTTKKVQKDVEVVDDILCNMCGGSCRNLNFEPPEGQEEHRVFDFATLELHTGSFGSKFDARELNDLERIDLCDTCCIKLLASLKLKPQVDDGFAIWTPTPEGDWEVKFKSPEAEAQWRWRFELCSVPIEWPPRMQD